MHLQDDDALSKMVSVSNVSMKREEQHNGSAGWLAAALHETRVVAKKIVRSSWKPQPQWALSLARKKIMKGGSVSQCATTLLSYLGL